MHMSDALVSPAVGATLWAATAGISVAAARRLDREADDGRVALMGVLGAFVFAAQMVNFTIPGTGSSGHLGGGLLLAVILGPWAAFLVMASVLAVQAFFFADGGLLALGANVFNLGFFTAFLAYPLVYRPIAGPAPSRARLVVGSLAASLVGLELGALGVVVETAASGVSTLPLGTFLALMLPVHAGIGLVEGVVTAAVLLVLARARPELVRGPARAPPRELRPVLVGLGLAAALTGGVVSWFASVRPDGLEWSLARAGFEEGEPTSGVVAALARLQGTTALLPGYGFAADAAGTQEPEAWPAPKKGTSLAGLAGGLIVLAVAVAAGLLVRLLRRRPAGTS